MEWFDIVCLWFGRVIIIGSASLFTLIWLFMYIYVMIARTKTGRAYLRISKYIEKTYDKYFSTDMFLAAKDSGIDVGSNGTIEDNQLNELIEETN